MNLERLAALRGEAWARRMLRQLPPTPESAAESPWPGGIADARRLAATLGRPALLERLAAIIQERASATWRILWPRRESR
jgi:hypothetical protein